jgi:hypothetical protein
MVTSFQRPRSCIAAAIVAPSGEKRGWSKTRSGAPAASGLIEPLRRSTNTSPQKPSRHCTATARRPSGAGSAPRMDAP